MGGEKVMEERFTDRFGTWIVQKDGAKRLIEESPEWIKEQKNIAGQNPLVEPAQEEYMMDLDYRLSLLELGL